MPDLNFADGVSGNSIKMLLNGVPVLGLQNMNWKIARDKKALTGAGFAKAHGVTRSIHKTYEIDFEITELLSNAALRAAMGQDALDLFVDPTDIQNAVIILAYPGADVALSKTFTGVEITAADGGLSNSDDAEPVSIKCSGFCTDMFGVI